MPEYTISFEVKEANTIELPNQRYAAGRYRVEADEKGGVDVFGNREGLLYLAEVLVRCALGDHKAGFHVHIPRKGVVSLVYLENPNSPSTQPQLVWMASLSQKASLGRPRGAAFGTVRGRHW